MAFDSSSPDRIVTLEDGHLALVPSRQPDHAVLREPWWMLMRSSCTEGVQVLTDATGSRAVFQLIDPLLCEA